MDLSLALWVGVVADDSEHCSEFGWKGYWLKSESFSQCDVLNDI